MVCFDNGATKTKTKKIRDHASDLADKVAPTVESARDKAAPRAGSGERAAGALSRRQPSPPVSSSRPASAAGSASRGSAIDGGASGGRRFFRWRWRLGGSTPVYSAARSFSSTFSIT